MGVLVLGEGVWKWLLQPVSNGVSVSGVLVCAVLCRSAVPVCVVVETCRPFMFLLGSYQQPCAAS